MFLNLSYPLTDDFIVMDPGMDPPEVTPRSRLEQGKHSNTSYFRLFAHTGTHMDAPWHFIQNGWHISDFKVQDLVFSQVVLLDIPCEADEPVPAGPLLAQASALQFCDCLLVRTGFGKLRAKGSEEYFRHNPGFSVEAAEFLTTLPSLRCLGMDIGSVENVPHGRETGFPVHHVLLGQSQPMILLEDANLAVLDSRKIARLFLFPLLLEGLEAAPVTAVAEITDED